MRILKIIFILRKSSGVPFFFTKNIHREARAGATGNHEKKLFIEKNVFQYVLTTYQNLKKNLLQFQKYLGKTDSFFKFQHPVSRKSKHLRTKVIQQTIIIFSCRITPLNVLHLFSYTLYKYTKAQKSYTCFYGERERPLQSTSKLLTNLNSSPRKTPNHQILCKNIGLKKS